MAFDTAFVGSVIVEGQVAELVFDNITVDGPFTETEISELLASTD